jgi:hypothetical protein
VFEATTRHGGTKGSNPVPSSGEPVANCGEGAQPELGQTFKLTPDQWTEESHSTTI